jgi:small conductance mechanosensitive channel
MSFDYILNRYIIPYSINIGIAIIIYFLGKLIIPIIIKVIEKLLDKTSVEQTLKHFIKSIVKSLLYVLLIIAVLSKVGVDTSSFVAILGALTFAIGFALKDSLNNFASGAMVILFKPFKIGDVVDIAGGTVGAVKAITMFNTTLTTPDNQKIMIPNGLVWGGKITNITAHDTRRVDLTFGIGYGDDMKKAKELMAKVLDENPKVLKDPAYVIAVSELGDSSVNFVVRPWAKTSDYWTVRAEIIEAIKESFDNNGISIPYPQMDVHLDK